MNYTSDINDIQGRLRETNPSQATLWDFRLSHAVTLIKLTWTNSRQVAFLMILGTQRIQCPISWSTPQLVVFERTGENGIQTTTVQDTSHAVTVSGDAGVVLYEGNSDEFGEPGGIFVLDVTIPADSPPAPFVTPQVKWNGVDFEVPSSIEVIRDIELIQSRIHQLGIKKAMLWDYQLQQAKMAFLVGQESAERHAFMAFAGVKRIQCLVKSEFSTLILNKPMGAAHSIFMKDENTVAIICIESDSGIHWMEGEPKSFGTQLGGFFTNP